MFIVRNFDYPCAALSATGQPHLPCGNSRWAMSQTAEPLRHDVVKGSILTTDETFAEFPAADKVLSALLAESKKLFLFTWLWDPGEHTKNELEHLAFVFGCLDVDKCSCSRH